MPSVDLSVRSNLFVSDPGHRHIPVPSKVSSVVAPSRTGGLENVVSLVSDSGEGGEDAVEISGTLAEWHIASSYEAILDVDVKDASSVKPEFLLGAMTERSTVSDVVIDAEHGLVESVKQSN